MKALFLLAVFFASTHSLAEEGVADLSLVIDAKLCGSSFLKLGMTQGPSPVAQYSLRSAELDGALSVEGTGPLAEFLSNFVPGGSLPLQGTVAPGTNGVEAVNIDLREGAKPGEVMATFQYKMQKDASVVSGQVKDEQQMAVTGKFKQGRWTDVAQDQIVEIEIPMAEILKALKASVPPPAAVDPNKIFHVKGKVKIERFAIANLSANGKQLSGGEFDLRATVQITLPKELKDLIRDEGVEALLGALPDSQFHWEVQSP